MCGGAVTGCTLLRSLPGSRPRSAGFAAVLAREAANGGGVNALYAAWPGQSDAASRGAVDVAITALGHGRYRHHVVDGDDDLPSAQQGMRGFLIGIEYRGLGLSDDMIEIGVSRVEA